MSTGIIQASVKSNESDKTNFKKTNRVDIDSIYRKRLRYAYRKDNRLHSGHQRQPERV